MTIEPNEKIKIEAISDARLDRIERILEGLDAKSPTQLNNIESMLDKNHSTLQNKLKDVVLLGLLAANFFLNILAMLDMSISFATHDIPVLECKVVPGDKATLDCYRPEQLAERMLTPKIVEPNK